MLFCFCQVVSLLADKRLTTLTSASGIELNRPLVWWSRLAAWRNGQWSRASFDRRDLWKTDFACYQSVVIFGVDTMVGNLAPEARMPGLGFVQPAHCFFNLIPMEISTTYLATRALTSNSRFPVWIPHRRLLGPLVCQLPAELSALEMHISFYSLSK